MTIQTDEGVTDSHNNNNNNNDRMMIDSYKNNNNNNNNADVEDDDDQDDEEEEEDDDDDDDSKEEIGLKFRNYRPKDKKLQEYVLARPPLPNITKEITSKLDQLITIDETQQLGNLAPKKPTWDLKRDVEKKLEKLDKKTQQSILKLIQANLQSQLLLQDNGSSGSSSDSGSEEDDPDLFDRGITENLQKKLQNMEEEKKSHEVFENLDSAS